MDAYDLQQKLLEAWRQVAFVNDAGDLNKKWNLAEVHVDGKVVKDVIIHENKILLVTDNE